MRRQRFVSQGALSRTLQTATDAWNSRDFDKAFEVLERACRLDPANSGILLDLGGAYGKRFYYAEAERCFEKAIRIAPNKIETLIAVGRQCREFGKYEMAEIYFRRAAEQKNALPESFVYLAEVYERLRRLDEAAHLTERALNRNPAFPAGLLMQARLERQAGHLENAERLLRSLLFTPEMDVRVRAGYELGAVLDRQGRYDEAMSTFVEAKNLLRPDASRHLSELRTLRARLGELRTNLSTEILSRFASHGQALEPAKRLAVLCGNPRSGTTLLEQVLDCHPDIVSAEETEIFHDDAYSPLTRNFPPDAPMLTMLEAASTELLRQSRENYVRSVERFLGSSVNGRLLVDKNPSLTFLVASLVRVFPEARFLVAVRDPRDVCLSCFMQFLPLNQASSAFLTLEGTVEEYLALMNMWRTIAPLMVNPHLEIHYEDLVDDLEGTSRRVLKFLDIPWDTRVLRFDEHARQKAVRSPTYADVTKPVFRTAMGRWRNYQKHLEPHLKGLERFLEAFGYG